MRIAVVGGGVSGLCAAAMLAPRHDVVLFEAATRLGGHTNTVRLDLADETHHVDTGFIVHNRRNYPVLCEMFDSWGVETQPGEMSFSVSCERTGLEYAGTTLSGLFAQRRNIVDREFWLLLREIARFGRVGRRALAAEIAGADGPSLDAFLAEHRFAPVFVDRYLIPLGAAVWSADPRSFARFPALALLHFLDNHGLLTLVHRPQWRTVVGGANRYVDAAVRSMRAEVRVATPVHRVTRDHDGVDVHTPHGTHRFDALVLAAHSDQALAMLGDPSDVERDVLSAIRYQRNIAVLHTDERMLPRSRRAWAAWNYRRPAAETGLPAVTYYMNRLQRLTSQSTICVTLNRENEIDPAREYGRYEYHHPVFDQVAFAAHRRWDEVNGVRRTWYCGAWWGYGFHEDGAASAWRVADAIARVPA